MNKNKKSATTLIFVLVCLLLFVYIGIFTYLNMFKFTQHVDSDIAVDALLAREIWVEKSLTPDNWIASTERLVVGVPALASLFYGASGSMVFSMGISCVIVGILLLATIAFTLKRCRISNLGIATALLSLCALPINGIRNDGQMVPFVILLWFLFADYYALHSICLFLCIAFYLHLRENITNNIPSGKKSSTIIGWLVLVGLCGGLALGGMRCLQVVIFPLVIWEILLLFFESKHMGEKLPAKRFQATGFIFTLLLVGVLAKLYPTNVDYPMYFQTSEGMISRLIKEVPAAVLSCLGIAGNCLLTSFSAVMQMGIVAVVILTIYGIVFLLRHKTKDKSSVPVTQKMMLQALCASFLFTVFVEVVTTAETAHNYFFMVWFVVIAVFAMLITYFEKAAPHFARLIALCVCCFAVCNIFYTYKNCITTKDNLAEYEEVISYMESENITHGYSEFWDSSRISLMTDGAITMGHCYRMEDMYMYWWTTSTKWYVPNLPEQMPTAYVVHKEDKDAFIMQFEDPSVVSLGFENERFAVYISEWNLVPMT